MNHPKHIIWLCSGLHLPGGTERANLNAAHLMLKHGNRVTIVVLDESGSSFYPLDPQINLVHKKYFFGIEKKGNKISRKISMLREFYSLKRLLIGLEPSVIIATDYPFAVACVITGLHKKFKVISWEHHHYAWLKKSLFWQKLIRYTYPKLSSILVPNNDEEFWYKKMGCNTNLIPNFITEFPIINKKPLPIILTVGWLIERKGIDLIPAMAQNILNSFPAWKWIIIGEGELEKDLIREIENRELNGRLIIQKPVRPLEASDYQQASIYVMTSRLEPFGLVLIEAMSNRLPCIAFDCPTGPRNIIRHETDGFLVAPFDTKTLESHIVHLIEDENLREQMGVEALSGVQKFSAENVWPRWANIIKT